MTLSLSTTDREDLAALTEATRSARIPEVGHATFRAVLDALARPGTRHRLPTGAVPNVPAVLLPTLALADLGVAVHVAGGPGWAGAWSEAVALATDATPTDPDRARLLVLGPDAPDGLLAGAAVGSAAAPEDAALVTVAVDDATAGGAPLWLRGPGVDGTRRLAPRGLPARWLEARGTASFPAGFDLLLVDDHGVVGLPRSTRIDVHDPAAGTDPVAPLAQEEEAD